MKAKLLLILLIIAGGCSTQKEIFEPGSMKVDPLSELFKLTANSVVRDHHTTLNIIDTENAVFTVKEAVTIYNKEGKDHARVVLNYNKFKNIEYLNANILNANGEVVRSFSLKDASDFSNYSGYTFFSDNRVKVLDLNYNSFPYTTEVEYQVRYSETLNLPAWYPKTLGQAIQKASLRVEGGTGDGIHFHTNLEKEAKVKHAETGKIYEWEIENELPVEREAFGPPPAEILPHVLLKSTHFSVENSTGKNTSWQEFGKWYYALGKDSRELSASAKKEVDEVLKGIESEKEKVIALYRYLQNKTRYVNIQLGIGGWKPFSAEYVYSNEYGDCKALTNYMQAILEYAGISVKPALIRSGLSEPQVIAEFPGNQFNHVIIQVTLSDGEIIWLECTSKYLPPGQIGGGNEGRYALLISPKGGELIKTPESKAADNRRISFSEIAINEAGRASVQSTITQTGISQSELLHRLKPVSDAKKTEWLKGALNVPAEALKSADFSSVIPDEKGSEYTFKIEMDNFASASSSRLFIPLNAFNKWNLNPPEEKNRNQGVWLPYRFTEIDSSLIKLPEGYKIETVPADVHEEKAFGEYKTSFTVTEAGDMWFKRELSLKKKRLSAEEYSDFREFFNQVTLSDNQNFVVVKDI